MVHGRRAVPQSGKSLILRRKCPKRAVGNTLRRAAVRCAAAGREFVRGLSGRMGVLHLRCMRKNYILDANILIHDPNSIFQFADNTVIIPVAVLSEIDRFKKEMTDRGYSARAVVRLLDSLRNGQSLAVGVPLEGGGTLRVHCDPDDVLSAGSVHADTEILRVAQATQRAEADTPVVIVTKDINLRIRADAAGLRAEDYEADRVLLADVSAGFREQVIESAALARPLPSGKYPVHRRIRCMHRQIVDAVINDNSEGQHVEPGGPHR